MIKLGKDGSRYLPYIPKTVPRGLRLVHNFPPDLEQRSVVGLRGFRIWVESSRRRRPDEMTRVLCRCGFAPHLKHYGVKRDEQQVKQQVTVS